MNIPFKHLGLFVALSSVGVPVSAQEGPFSAGSEARSWNLAWEEPARFEATVVDLLCEVAGDCGNACTDGRQVGLLRSLDGVLTYPNKNNQGIFTGAAVDLAPFCGELVEVDGLLIEDEYVGATNVYLVQMIRRVGEDDWTTADGWTDAWAEAFPEAAAQEGRWYRNDPRILALIEADGYLGTGETWQEAWEATR
ncbi:hypothetical protein [Gymnodinialimonas ceratoperidinii]|uniref:Uncharacterized protein n=1 Tax=Gymnodinialimonas ceratoperidinii TaxID=2856823 RepID=A0A8F6TY90_9RHOB|nr:hypothetical protein [Gymnodinialimonas ceratoperidinii]QXT40905.1 hypothetical protein KYE46_06680 [Gymnodinialimonas ceratoperidinii]